jgi:thiamine-phosphate pyrophosphorylase
MSARQPYGPPTTLPRVWLLTDERQGDGLFAALARLPPGAGIVFRHYSLPENERRGLFREVLSMARKSGQLLLLAGPAETAKAWRADGSHGRGPGAGLRSAPAHDLGEIRAAGRDGAALIFLSPVFRTRSHRRAEPLGPVRFGFLCRRTRLPVIALGGVDAKRAKALRLRGAYGWGGIDAWSG